MRRNRLPYRIDLRGRHTKVYVCECGAEFALFRKFVHHYFMEHF